jgi:hypothetical protein
VLLLALLAALPAAAQDARGIASYRETIDLATDGSAGVAIELMLANWAADRVDLPLNVGKPDNFAVTGDGVKAAASAARNGDVRVIRVQFEGKPAAAAKLRITFTAREFLDWKKARSPRGIYGLSYTFTNTGTANVGQYRLTVRLPEGYEMNGVSSSTPRMTGEEVEPPYDFVTEDGRTVVNLRAKSVAPGRTATIAFGFVKRERNPLPVIAIGMLVVAGALWIKRDVLTRADYVRETAA